MTLLIVEDEIRIREGLCKLLGKQFPEIEIVAVAENGLEGLVYLEYHRPDMVITDIKMPGMDGLEMLTKAQALGLCPKVIVLTAYSEFAYAQQAVRLGVCDYLVKPIVMQEFVQTVRKLQALCEQERRRTPETVGSLETVLSGVLHSGMPLNEETTAFLERAYGLGPNDNILELLFYLGDGTLISCPEITRLQTEVCVYPIELENQMKISICAGDLPRVRKLARQFHAYFSGTKIYTPGEIKDSYVRFLWSFLSIAKEVGHMDGQAVEQREVLDRVMSARTVWELRQPFEAVLSVQGQGIADRHPV